MSTINPNFQPTNFRDSLPADLSSASSVVVKDGKIAKQSGLSKFFTSVTRMAPGSSLYIKHQNQKTLKALTGMLEAKGLSQNQISSLLEPIKNDQGVKHKILLISGDLIKPIVNFANQLDAKSVDAQLSIENAISKAGELGHSKLEGLVMGIVNAGESVTDLSGNQLAPLADEVVKALLPDVAGASTQDKIEAIEAQLEALNGLQMKNLIADLSEGLLAKEGDDGAIKANPQAADLINLVKYKLNCQLTSLRPQGEAVFVQNPPSTLTPKLRREHTFEALKPDSPLSAAMAEYGVKAKSPQAAFDKYCRELEGDGSKSFLRNSNPAAPYLDIVRVPLKEISSEIQTLVSGLTRTASGDEFEPVPPSAGDGPSVGPRSYTQAYEEKLQSTTQSFMQILENNPKQKAEFCAAVKSINDAFASAIDKRENLAEPARRKIEALNSILQRTVNTALPMNTPDQIARANEFTTHISRAILLTEPKHVEATVFNNFRALFA